MLNTGDWGLARRAQCVLKVEKAKARGERGYQVFTVNA
jgi:hypothetical protein